MIWITPACAGKSCRQSNDIPMFWDHPRVCGEKVSDCKEEKP